MSHDPIPVTLLGGNTSFAVQIAASDELVTAQIQKAVSGKPQIHVGPSPPADTGLLWLDTSD
jgi:hypothetical protein